MSDKLLSRFSNCYYQSFKRSYLSNIRHTNNPFFIEKKQWVQVRRCSNNLKLYFSYLIIIKIIKFDHLSSLKATFITLAISSIAFLISLFILLSILFTSFLFFDTTLSILEGVSYISIFFLISTFLSFLILIRS